jgi:hypothetical protein
MGINASAQMPIYNHYHNAAAVRIDSLTLALAEFMLVRTAKHLYS